MLSTVSYLLGACLVAYLAMGAYLALNQRQFLYFPTSETHYAEIQHHWLTCSDVKLKVWVVQPQQTEAVLYFGGNAEQVGETAFGLSEVFPDSS